MFTSLFKKKKQELEYYVALEISSEKVNAIVFSLTQNSIEIVGSSSQEYNNDWNSLIDATDTAVSKAAGEIILSDIKKVIFAVPPDYLENNKIKTDILPHLKKLTQELELIPSGFVVTPEAINFYLQKERGFDRSLLIGLGSQEIILSLFDRTKVVDHVKINKDESTLAAIQKGINRFENVEVLPSRVLLYGRDNLNKVKEEILNYPWMSHSKFLHLPKIEILPQQFCVEAIVAAAASELNNKVVPVINTRPGPETADIVPKKEAFSKVSRESLGFTSGVSQDSLTSSKLQESPSLSKISSLPFLNVVNPLKKNPLPEKVSTPENNNRSPLFMSKKIIFPTVLVLLLACLFAGYVFASYTLPKATVTLIVDPRVYKEEKEIAIDTDIIAPSTENNAIPGKLLSVPVSSSSTVPTTGKKLVGEPAKGKVTLYNKTTTSRKFAKGTKLTAKNLVFLTDEDIEIPAAAKTATADSESLTYGKNQSTVTAQKIGADGNLTSATEFTVEDFSNTSYSARNDEAFNGGTSREVAAVSSKDKESLLTAVKDELKQKAETDLTAKLTGSEKLLADSLTAEIMEEKYSSEVNTETKELTLNLTINYEGLIYKEDDFRSIMEVVLRNNIPQGYEFKAEETSIEVTQAEDKTDKTFKADFTARLFPQLDLVKIKKEISGIPTTQIEQYVKSITNVAGYEIVFKSPFSLFTSKLPRLPQNITIEVKSR